MGDMAVTKQRRLNNQYIDNGIHQINERLLLYRGNNGVNDFVDSRKHTNKRTGIGREMMIPRLMQQFTILERTPHRCRLTVYSVNMFGLTKYW